ncbi:MAG: hypothetical protein CMB99_10225 [Flavobacteriaceae bacterium]|nr:hypothetical protein [Flavobacteriaceae bacterium]|tara:strand:- start:293100 stop:295829 length:2730 start_codon:yes stop_codon:yes gene_type:complete
MQTFISESLDDIIQQHQSLRDVCIVLPSQRAKIFLKNALKSKVEIGFLPEVFTIEDWIGNITKLRKVETTELLFRFYGIYLETEKSPESFQKFIDWAPTVLNDFNEIDQYLVDIKSIFDYLRDIQRLRKWSVTGTFQETDLIKSHQYFLEKLHPLYAKLYEQLLQTKQGYQGLIYREAVKGIAEYLDQKSSHSFYFLGFNALNKAEEQLITTTLRHNESEIYWDIDRVFLEKGHQCARFINKYLKSWEHYQGKEVKIGADNFEKLNDIQVVGTTKEVSQIKAVSQILENSESATNTALVLGDESVLPIVLNSIPKNIAGVNITMGYQLKDLPIASFFSKILQMHKDRDAVFYFKDVLLLLNHPALGTVMDDNTKQILSSFVEKIHKTNRTFLSDAYIKDNFANCSDTFKSILELLFSAFLSVPKFIDRFINLIDILKVTAAPVQKESLFRFYTIFKQIKSLDHQLNYLGDVKTLQYFFDRYLGKESLFFQGEPLMGLQIMGMLETRVLDFENLIITGVNEGILPKNSNANSFVPFDVKLAYGLPTYKEKDAIFSYHFFRLISRAKKVYLLFNSVSDDFGQGEKSRFLMQLELLKPSIKNISIAPKVTTEKVVAKTIDRNPEIYQKLQKHLARGLSSTAITTFLNNPLTFYKKYVLGIHEADEVEETIAANTLGTVIHETLRKLYTPFVNKYLEADDIENMQNQSQAIISEMFGREIREGNIREGKNRLIFEVAKSYIKNFLNAEKKLLSDENNALKILSLEADYKTEITIEGLDFPVVLKGQIDRIDELNGTLRVIDYKTGKVESGNLKVLNFEDLKEEKFHKAIQLFVYALMVANSNKFDTAKPMVAGNISFKKLKSGLQLINFSSSRTVADNTITKERLNAFETALKSYITEMISLESFVENLEARY